MANPPSAIELAEGALLADIAVLFQLLVVYIPIAGAFSLFIPTVFAVLVLRRSLYVAVLSLCVAVFVACVLTGIGSLIGVLLPGGAGLFLGVAMKYRLRHIPLVLLGIGGSTATLLGLLLLSAWLTGLGIQAMVLQIHGSAATAARTMGWLSGLVGLGDWWQFRAYPALLPLGRGVLANWLAALLVGCFVLSWPLVLTTYWVTNRFVLALGYAVRPLPAGLLIARIKRWRRALNERVRARQGARP